LLGVGHSDNGGVNFCSSSSDEYVNCHVSVESGELSLESVFPEVSDFGVQPIHVRASEGRWVVSFKLPPGLAAGWHPVRLRTAAGESEPMEIAVDVPLNADGLTVKSAADAISWEPLRASLSHGFLTIWALGLPRNADIANVKVELAGKRQTPTFVGAPGADGVTQLNVALNPRTPLGESMLRLRFGGAQSPPFPIELTV
jgi:hypothetical protein